MIMKSWREEGLRHCYNPSDELMGKDGCSFKFTSSWIAALALSETRRLQNPHSQNLADTKALAPVEDYHRDQQVGWSERAAASVAC